MRWPGSRGLKKEDPFIVLDLEYDATPEEIKKRYRELAVPFFTLADRDDVGDIRLRLSSTTFLHGGRVHICFWEIRGYLQNLAHPQFEVGAVGGWCR